MRRPRFAVVSVLLLGLTATSARVAAGADEATTIYRDEFGIPHIFAPTLNDAAFAVGYAQAEDRLEELLKNYRRATGTMAEVFGARRVPRRLATARHAARRDQQGPLRPDQPENARGDRIVSKRDQAVHEGPSRAGSRLGPANPTVGRGRTRPLHHLELADG